MIWLTRLLSFLLLPFLALWLAWRLIRRKEEFNRFSERLGQASHPRPRGPLVWFHCASVGESLSIQPLIAALGAKKPRWHILVTTGTRSAATLMATRLPQGAIHQYVPLDLYPCVTRFMKHWKPDLSLFVESELWPELLHAAPHPVLLNARMSDRSWPRYKRFPAMARALLGRCEAVLCQSPTDVTRFRTFTPYARLMGNLKYDFPPLSADNATLRTFKKYIGSRPVVVVASTHHREEAMAVRWQRRWHQQSKDVLVVIVPRHPDRTKDFVNLLPPHSYGLRSRGDAITPDTQFYIGDTFGEMGLWFTLASVVVMGGSFVPHGGHNPLEPLKLNKPVFTGPHMFNFRDMMATLTQAGLVRQVPNETTLLQELTLPHLPSPPLHALTALEGATATALDYIIRNTKG